MVGFDWSQYRGNLKWLPERTLYLTLHGSHAYGTNTPESDVDVRGIAVAPKDFYLGVGQGFEQATQLDPVDLTVFELRKFLKLASDTNPNALELLFTDPSDHLYVHPLMRPIFEARDAFLSRRALYTFSGYSRSQMRRIQNHHRWLKNPMGAPPNRADFGLGPETVIPKNQLEAAQANIRKKLDSWTWRAMEELTPDTRMEIQAEFVRRLSEITLWGEDDIEEKKWFAATRACGYDTNFIEVLDKERRYNAKLSDWKSYQKWLKSRNPDRAKLEAKFGYDTKHASHLIRLGLMCEELLTTGTLVVKRPDADYLLRVRAGEYSYEYIMDYSDTLDVRLKELAESSPLPKRPDLKKINALCVDTIQQMLDK